MAKLFRFEYDIVYQPSKENKVVDIVSRKERSLMIWITYKENESRLMALNGVTWKI